MKPDMKLPGAHIQKVRQDWETRIKQFRRKAAALNAEADALQLCIHEWDEAIRLEDEKSDEASNNN